MKKTLSGTVRKVIRGMGEARSLEISPRLFAESLESELEQSDK